MKLDNDLVRSMLLQVETDVDGNINYRINCYCEKNFPSYPVDVTTYHMKYLLDARFIQGNNGYFRDITPAGRDFLNNIRDEKVWSETKKAASKVGGVAIGILSDIAASVVKKMFDLP